MENNATDSKLRSVKTGDVARLMELFQVENPLFFLIADAKSFF